MNEIENKALCVSCNAPTEDHLCDDCFAELPEGEWVTVDKRSE